jgi:hypothetical protein
MTATPKVLPETPERQPGAPGAADVLSDVLRVIHLSGAIFFHACVSPGTENTRIRCKTNGTKLRGEG